MIDVILTLLVFFITAAPGSYDWGRRRSSTSRFPKSSYARPLTQAPDDLDDLAWRWMDGVAQRAKTVDLPISGPNSAKPGSGCAGSGSSSAPTAETTHQRVAGHDVRLPPRLEVSRILFSDPAGGGAVAPRDSEPCVRPEPRRPWGRSGRSLRRGPLADPFAKDRQRSNVRRDLLAAVHRPWRFCSAP